MLYNECRKKARDMLDREYVFNTVMKRNFMEGEKDEFEDDGWNVIIEKVDGCFRLQLSKDGKYVNGKYLRLEPLFEEILKVVHGCNKRLGNWLLDR